MELDEEVASQDQVQMADILTCSLPTSRVKKICRLDPDLAMIGSDAILFLTKAAELFVGELAKASYTEAVLEKRKTIQTKDIDKAIASKAMFDFLEDTLCDWPDAEMSRAPTQEEEAVPESSDKMLASVEEETEDDGDDENVAPAIEEETDILQADSEE